MPNYTKVEVMQACKFYASQLLGPLPSGVEPAQLLWAMSGNESSFGADCTPRHEPAYDVGGRYADNNLLKKYGRAAACSYGPWQIMFSNCPPTYTPAAMDDLDNAAYATVHYLSRQVARFKPASLEAIGAIWNGGSPNSLNLLEVQQYAAKLVTNYSVPMPEDAPAATLAT